MILKNNNLLFAAVISAISLNAYAADEHMVIAPQCLIDKANVEHKTLATEKSLSLIEVSSDGILKLAAAKTHRIEPCGGFMDVSEAWQKQSAKKIAPAAFLSHYARPAKTSRIKETSYTIQYQAQVNQLFKIMNPQNMWTDLTKLTSFQTRSAISDNGVNAANWIKSQFEAMAKASGRNDITVYTVDTGSWYKQPSVVTKIGNSNEPGIVIGGHMDTLPTMWGNMPGADDDGSGTVTVLEVARTILASGMHFKKPIYLVWYAAEEEGLYGSQAVVADFVQKKIPVNAVMQLDMTGYRHKNDPAMWLYDDYTNKDLTAYTATLIDTYVKQPIKHSNCGYACSDHASWTEKGFASVMPFEAQMGTDNPDIHTANDTMDKLSLDHMTSFAKLAIAFAVEMGEPII